MGRVGWRPNPGTGSTVSTLLTSVYASWNAEALGTTLDSSVLAVYNGESIDSSLDTSIYAAWNAENTVNDSVGTKHGTLVNGTTFTTGKVGQAFVFDGVNDYIQLPNNTFNLTGDFTIAFWYNPQVLGVAKTIISNYNSSTTGGHANGTGISIVQASNNTIGIYTFNTGYVYLESNVAMSLNTWYHIVVSRKSATGTTLYVNGVFSRSNTSTLDPVYPAATYSSLIGNSSTGSSYITAKLDGLTVWNRQLSSTDVAALYNAGTGVEYPFAGKTLTSPNTLVGTNHGTLAGGTTFAAGKFGTAFKFNGTNSYVSLPDNSLNLTGDFTISVWVYPTSGAAQTILSNVGYTSGSINKGWSLGINNISGAQTSKVSWWQGIGPATTQYTGWEFRTTSLTLNAWNHILITRVSGVNTYCEVNSILQTPTIFGTGANVAVDPIYHTTNKANIGAGMTLAGVAGSYLAANTMVDGLAIWNKAITPGEKTQLYNLGTGAQYPFSSQTLPSTNDSVGTSHGTLTNGATFTTGKIGQAFTFDGINDYISLGDTLDIRTSSWTYNYWVKFQNVVNTQIIISKSIATFASSRFAFGLVGGKLYTFVCFNAGTDFQCNGTTSISPSTWIMVTNVIDRSGNLKIYLNGVQETLTGSSPNISAYSTNDVNSTYPCRIGASTTSDGAGVNAPLSGQLDGMSVWNRVLTQTEITELYNSGTGKQYPFS